jgi:LPLT family lysophospholipid transporter-like MFS transporter
MIAKFNKNKPAGFNSFLCSQFLSALADNALFFVAIALLAKLNAPTWHQPLLLQFFVLAYIVLAPFVGAFADLKPKSLVMFFSNGIKFFGCLTMVFGMPPLYSYAIVGIGAAAYSPAKYGILTELLPENLLVEANGWVEGLTITAIILGALIGGFLTYFQPEIWILNGLDIPIILISGLYVLAAIFNKFIPQLPVTYKLEKIDPIFLVKDFSSSFYKLWKDPLGQLSLTITTLFWGAGATLRLVIIAWAAIALNFGLNKSTQLSAIVAIGVAIGAIIAAKYIKMKDSVRILPLGILMGILVCSIVFITEWQTAAFILLFIGVFSGLLIVPLNALLQYRGHRLIGAGHSIAVQNFNENLGILLLSGAYTYMVKANLPINGIVFIFGFFLILAMTVASQYYSNN